MRSDLPSPHDKAPGTIYVAFVARVDATEPIHPNPEILSSMTSLRQKFTDLAQELSAEAERRRQFVVKNRQETQRMCESFQREREQLGQQLHRQAKKISRELLAGRQAMQRRVARTLTDLRSQRQRSASEQRSQRYRFVAGIQRAVASGLERNRASLAANSRQRALTTTQTMMRLRSSVAKIRSESIRLTSSTANDLLAGRRALAAARSRRLSGGYPMLRPILPK